MIALMLFIKWPGSARKHSFGYHYELCEKYCGCYQEETKSITDECVEIVTEENQCGRMCVKTEERMQICDCIQSKVAWECCVE